MSVLVEKQIITPEEYLEREAAKLPEQGKSEYFDGEIYDMSIVSDQHDQITGNIFGHFWTFLRKEGYRVMTSDLRTKLSPTKYALPDVTVVKGKPVYSPDEFYNLLNPHLIVEVLSDGTEAVDRGKKFSAYRALETLQEYILVSQYEYLVECYYRDENGKWMIGNTYTLPSDTVVFKSVPCQMTLADIYEDVAFETGRV